MKRKVLLTTLALSLGCLFGGSGAMAQNGWESVYKQTKTTSDDWTKLDQGSTTGKVLGAKGVTNYYYINKSLNFTNDRTDNDGNGNSGLKIQGTVYLYIPAGLHIECRGANADGRTGAGAGIELSEGNTLYIIGGGDDAYVKATGGNATYGRDGGKGGDASGVWDKSTTTGTGGTGGNGGGGAGAGIGTRGGNGGTGGAGGGSNTYYDDSNSHSGTNGSSGTAGSTAANMGKLYVDQTLGITVTATGGNAGTYGGAGGGRGKGRIDDDNPNYSVSGGGGGGGGGFGGAAANIGTGGPGGGGGGGGAGGAQNHKYNGYYDVSAYGGKGGQNTDGSYAAEGTESLVSRSNVDNGWVDTNYKWGVNDANSGGKASWGSGGSGGGKGNAASNGTMNEGKLTYTITYNFVKPDFKTEKGSYTPSTGATVVLPQNSEGYQWALTVYGKDASADGSDPSVFATTAKQYFGGDSDKASDRTILLKDVYGNLVFQEVASVCKLNNTGDNSQVISELFYNPNIETHKYAISVRLKNRTLYKDGKWNTICLPCDLTADQIKASPLAGAQIKKMDAVNTGYYPNGYSLPEANIHTTAPTLILFFEDAKEIEAGKPYLVKWNEGSDLVDNTDEEDAKKIYHNLDFPNVLVTEKSPGSWECNDVVFQGTLSQSRTIEAGDMSRLLLGPGNKLYFPSENINVGACRGYFIIPQAAAKARQVILSFDDEDGETTSIINIENGTLNMENAAEAWFSLDGRRLNGKPSTKGVYVNSNGKKYVIQ